MTNKNIVNESKWIVLPIVLLFLFSCAPTSYYKQGEKEPKRKDQIYDVLKCFADTYGLIQRDHISPPTFLENFENALKGMQNLLGKERLSYNKTVRSISISSSGETIEVNDITEEHQRLKEFIRMFRFVERTNPEFNLQAIVYAASKGIAHVDSHSCLIPPDTYKRMREYTTRSRDESIGVNTLFRNGVLMVSSLVDNSPAVQAGILPGDQIVLIEGVPTKELGSVESKMRLSGQKGTNVTITIMREGFTGPREFTITRDVILLLLPVYKLLEEQYGYIRISGFFEKTDAEFEKGIKTLEEESKGSLKGLILDLRNNQGGLLDQCVKLADRFLESGLIISLTGRREVHKMKFYAHREGTLRHYPLVVLTSTGTVAGAEIVAGSLQDHKRAIIVGNQTSGEGTIQTFFPYRDGSWLRLTTAKWLTPNGKEIEGKGILPDLIVISKKDKSLSSVPSDRPMIVVDINEKDAILPIVLQILKNTSSSSFQDLMGAAKKINAIEMEQQQSGTPLKK